MTERTDGQENIHLDATTDPTEKPAELDGSQSPQVERDATRSRAAVVIEFPEPHLDGFPTEREDWVQGITEAAINGVRAWMHGAGLTTEPIVHYKEADHG